MPVNLCDDVPMIYSGVPMVKDATVFVESAALTVVIDPRFSLLRNGINNQNKFSRVNALQKPKVGEHLAKMFWAREFSYNRTGRICHADSQ